MRNVHPGHMFFHIEPYSGCNINSRVSVTLGIPPCIGVELPKVCSDLL